MNMHRLSCLAAVILLCCCFSRGQLSSADARAAVIDDDYRVSENVVYLTVNNYQNRLDVYDPAGDGPFPTLIYIHGGAWINGTKENSLLQTFPFLEKGWAVVNVEYRVTKVARAPAAVEDCRCALHWVVDHAKDYKFDLNRIVVMGGSAGGHLALMTGMAPATAGLDRECSADQEVKVAAILDWLGVTDVNDLLSGPNQRDWAIEWLGDQKDREEIARRVSPLTYVRPGLPPIFIVHGDADPVIPYEQSVRLHQALDKAGVPNELVTIRGGMHGRFSHTDQQMTYEKVWAFLRKYVSKAP
jgi:acetyl esterase/lipase